MRPPRAVPGSAVAAAGPQGTLSAAQSRFGIVPLTLLSRGEGSPREEQSPASVLPRSQASPGSSAGVTRCLCQVSAGPCPARLARSFGLSCTCKRTLIGCPLPKG